MKLIFLKYSLLSICIDSLDLKDIKILAQWPVQHFGVFHKHKESKHFYSYAVCFYIPGLKEVILDCSQLCVHLQNIWCQRLVLITIFLIKIHLAKSPGPPGHSLAYHFVSFMASGMAFVVICLTSCLLIPLSL